MYELNEIQRETLLKCCKDMKIDLEKIFLEHSNAVKDSMIDAVNEYLEDAADRFIEENKTEPTIGELQFFIEQEGEESPYSEWTYELIQAPRHKGGCM